MTGSLTDEQLVRATLRKDDRAFEELVQRHRSRVIGIVFRYGRDSQENEDMTQETFVRAYFSLPRFRFRSPFENWLSRIAVRVAMDHLRKRYRRRELFFADISADEPERREALLAAASGEKTDPIARDDLRNLLDQVLERLSPRERFLVTSRELEGRSVREIGELTGWGDSLIKVGLFRARKKMRKILERMLKEEGLPYES